MNSTPSLIAEAFSFAEGLHQGQFRKSTDIPYLYHLLSVAALVGEHGGNERQVAAALLHDAAEDQGGEETLGAIEKHFGKEIAAYVRACSDCTSFPKPPWRARKEAFIAKIPEMPEEAKLIVAADKLHNVRSMLRDHRQHGENLWKRFKGGRTGTLWYHASVAKTLAKTWKHPILDELQEAVEELLSVAESGDR
ncbi:MAG: HD domain-containing protein [Candidatus Hydrogenedentes bacterium]|nr:HD domain-containing protein [Candidatus Hydrogenedentota bacterium]